VGEYLGRGARASIDLDGDIVTVVVEGALTDGERRLVRDGMAELVLSIRRAFESSMRGELIAGVEAITGRQVRLCAHRMDTEIAVEVLVLEDICQATPADGARRLHTLALAGELDAATVPVLEATLEQLCADGAREIVLDLHELSFIDSSGLRLILSGKQLCERHGCDFALTRPRPAAQHLFELTGLVGRLSFRGRTLAGRIMRRHASADGGDVDRTPPDFEASPDLNLDAPRSARSFVRELLRGAAADERLSETVMLLTSELVTAVVLQGISVFTEAAKLRVWLRAAVLRVELGVPFETLLAPEPSDPRYEETVFAALADRWSIETSGASPRVWFEVDRHQPLGELPSRDGSARTGARGVAARGPTS
jgi:anti-sigma B factor antagonist